MYTGNFALIPSNLNDIESLIEESNAKGTNLYKDPSDWETANYHMPIADREMNSSDFCHQAIEASRVGYDFIKEELEVRNVLVSTSVEKICYWNMIEALQYRRPFITENDYVGLGPEHLDKDDVIVVFLDARFPYILRKSLLVGWILVGEAYVHGIMYRKFIEEEMREEVFFIY